MSPDLGIRKHVSPAEEAEVSVVGFRAEVGAVPRLQGPSLSSPALGKAPSCVYQMACHWAQRTF